MNNESITEKDSLYHDLEMMSVKELLQNIHEEDKKVLPAVSAVMPQIEELVEQVFLRMKKGGRLFYMGAGTSGRLGILDASEIPPTFGVGYGLVIGLIAGGDRACLLYTSPSPRDRQKSRMPSSA